MNDMKSNNTFKKPNRTILYVSIAVVIVGCVYGAAAYSYRLWPFTETTQEVSKPKTTTPQVTTAPETEDRQVDRSDNTGLSAITTKRAKVTFDKEQKLVTIVAPFTIDEQGDCTLTLTKGSESLVLKNSTNMVNGATGCLEWNIGTKNLAKGSYDLKITFKNKGNKLMTEDTLTF